MTLWLSPRSALVAACLSLLGCVGDPAPAPCTEDGVCLVGYECVERICIPCDPPDGCGGLRTAMIGPTGGRICGPDEACLDVPANSLTVTSTVFVRRSSHDVPGNLDVRSGLYDIGPLDTRLRIAATVRIPISPSKRLSDIAVYRVDGQGYVPLEGTTDAIYASGTTDKLGTFVAVRRPQ